MAYKKHILIGRIIKTHGFKGVVTIKTDSAIPDNITELESVFLEIDGKPVPFFIESVERAGPGIIRVKFSGYDSADKISEFIGCSVLMTHESLPENFTTDLTSLRGYKLLSCTGAAVGIIKDIINNPGQSLLNVRSESGKEMLIPLHEDLIRKIDPDKKILTMIFPEGLLDIN